MLSAAVLAPKIHCKRSLKFFASRILHRGCFTNNISLPSHCPSHHCSFASSSSSCQDHRAAMQANVFTFRVHI
jgi:hypothetical protein